MIQTAESAARDVAFSRNALDKVALPRFAQYQRALPNDRQFQRPWMQPVVMAQGKAKVVVEADEGVHPYTAEGLAALKPVMPDGVTTYDSQTHPAEGAAGAVICKELRHATLRGAKGSCGAVCWFRRC